MFRSASIGLSPLDRTRFGQASRQAERFSNLASWLPLGHGWLAKRLVCPCPTASTANRAYSVLWQHPDSEGTLENIQMLFDKPIETVWLNGFYVSPKEDGLWKWKEKKGRFDIRPRLLVVQK